MKYFIPLVLRCRLNDPSFQPFLRLRSHHLFAMMALRLRRMLFYIFFLHFLAGVIGHQGSKHGSIHHAHQHLHHNFGDDSMLVNVDRPGQIPSNESQLVKRDSYSCGKGKPCSNGACCGGSGYCGYGPKYCGADCVSNCNAVAECGKFAKPAGKKCPLNTCCSQYGFCGTTKDFCTDDCQSNCKLHPSPPGSPRGKALSKGCS